MTRITMPAPLGRTHKNGVVFSGEDTEFIIRAAPSHAPNGVFDYAIDGGTVSAL